MPFPAPLDLRHQPDGFYLTLAPFPYFGARDAWVIEAGFRTDLTSRPRPVGWLFDVGGDYSLAAVVHDYLRRLRRVCECGGRAAHSFEPGHRIVWRTPVNASDADGVYRRILGELGASAPRRWLMWAGVRVSCGMQDATGQDWYYVLLLTVPAALFLLVPLLVVLVFGGAFQLFEEVVRVVWDRCSRTSSGGLP